MDDSATDNGKIKAAVADKIKIFIPGTGSSWLFNHPRGLDQMVCQPKPLSTKS